MAFVHIFAPPGLPSSFWWGEKVGKVGILASWRESGNSHFVPTLSYFGQCTLSFAKCGSREMSHTGAIICGAQTDAGAQLERVARCSPRSSAAHRQV